MEKYCHPNLGFLIPSSWTMDFNLIVRLSGDTAANWVLRIGFQLRLIHRCMDRLRMSIRLQ